MGKLARNGSNKLSVIRQKGESQNRGNNKTKHTNFSKKMNISYPLYQVREKCSGFFYRKFGVLCFPVTSILRFAFLPYYRRSHLQFQYNNKKNEFKIFRCNLAMTPKMFWRPRNWSASYLYSLLTSKLKVNRGYRKGALGKNELIKRKISGKWGKRVIFSHGWPNYKKDWCDSFCYQHES